MPSDLKAIEAIYYRLLDECMTMFDQYTANEIFGGAICLVSSLALNASIDPNNAKGILIRGISNTVDEMIKNRENEENND